MTFHNFSDDHFHGLCDLGLTGVVEQSSHEQEMPDPQGVFNWPSSPPLPSLVNIGFGTSGLQPPKSGSPWKVLFSQLLKLPVFSNCTNPDPYESTMAIIVWCFVPFWGDAFPHSALKQTMKWPKWGPEGVGFVDQFVPINTQITWGAWSTSLQGPNLSRKWNSGPIYNKLKPQAMCRIVGKESMRTRSFSGTGISLGKFISLWKAHGPYSTIRFAAQTPATDCQMEVRLPNH